MATRPTKRLCSRLSPTLTDLPPPILARILSHLHPSLCRPPGRLYPFYADCGHHDPDLTALSSTPQPAPALPPALLPPARTCRALRTAAALALGRRITRLDHSDIVTAPVLHLLAAAPVLRALHAGLRCTCGACTHLRAADPAVMVRLLRRFPFPELCDLDLTGSTAFSSGPYHTAPTALAVDLVQLLRNLAPRLERLVIPELPQFEPALQRAPLCALRTFQVDSREHRNPDDLGITAGALLCALAASPAPSTLSDVALTSLRATLVLPPDHDGSALRQLLCTVVSLKVEHSRTQVAQAAFDHMAELYFIGALFPNLRTLQWSRGPGLPRMISLLSQCPKLTQIILGTIHIVRENLLNPEPPASVVTTSKSCFAVVEELGGNVVQFNIGLTIPRPNDFWGRERLPLRSVTLAIGTRFLDKFGQICRQNTETLRKLTLCRYTERRLEGRIMDDSPMDAAAWCKLVTAISSLKRLSVLHIRNRGVGPFALLPGDCVIAAADGVEALLEAMGGEAVDVNISFSCTARNLEQCSSILQAHCQALEAMRKYSPNLRLFSLRLGCYSEREHMIWNERAPNMRIQRGFTCLVSELGKAEKEMPSLQEVGVSGQLAQRFLLWEDSGRTSNFVCNA